MKAKTKRLSVELLLDVHNDLKDMVEASGTTIRKYVTDALMDKLEEENDKYWGERAKVARKEGFIGVEKSEDLLNRMKNA